MLRTAQGRARTVQRLWHALLAAGAFAAGLLSLSLGFADLLATDARQFLEDAGRPDRQVTHIRWKRAADGLRTARHLNPWNADYSADLARLYVWQSWQQVERPTAGEAYARAAAFMYRTSLTQRPSWGYAWAELADTAAAADGMTFEVLTALRLTRRLAPFEEQALRRALWIALPSWSSLNEGMREEVRALARNALRLGVRTRWLGHLAARFNWRGELRDLRRERGIRYAPAVWSSG